MLTCPNCLHVFGQQATQCCEPLLLSATVRLPPSPTPTTCTVEVTTTTTAGGGQCVRVLAGCGGGLVRTNQEVWEESTKSPQPSPSVPLTFVLPGPASFISQPCIQPDTDLSRLAGTLKSLRTSGWYYEGLSWQESVGLLKSTSPGTFLVRDSSDPRFLFSLSVQTERGPTSVRLHYVSGQFRLDAEQRLAPLMPLFDCVVSLVEHYVRACQGLKRKDQVWVDARGNMYSHILLVRPLYKSVPSLQHLSRLVINRHVVPGGVSKLPLPSSITSYLREYSYTQ